MVGIHLLFNSERVRTQRENAPQLKGNKATFRTFDELSKKNVTGEGCGGSLTLHREGEFASSIRGVEDRRAPEEGGKGIQPHFGERPRSPPA